MKKILITLLLTSASILFIGCDNNDMDYTINSKHETTSNKQHSSSNHKQNKPSSPDSIKEHPENNKPTLPNNHDSQINEYSQTNEESSNNEESSSEENNTSEILDNDSLDYTDNTLSRSLVLSILETETTGILDLDTHNINIKNFTYTNSDTIPHKYDSIFIPLNVNPSLLDDTNDIIKISLSGKTKDGTINYLPLNNLGNIHINPNHYQQGEIDSHIVELNSNTPQNIILGYDVDLNNYVSFTATIKNAYGGELYEYTTFREHMNEQ